MRTREEILKVADDVNYTAIRLERIGRKHEADQMALSASFLRWSVGVSDTLTGIVEELIREAGLVKESGGRK